MLVASPMSMVTAMPVLGTADSILKNCSRISGQPPTPSEGFSCGAMKLGNCTAMNAKSLFQSARQLAIIVLSCRP